MEEESFDELFKEGWARAKQVQGWFTPDDLKIMLKLALQVPEGGTIVEVGAWKGMSFVGMSVATVGRRHVAVDHFLGSDETWHQNDPDIGRLREVFEANLEKFGIEAEVIAEPSVEAARRFEKESIDLLLLDGSHVPEDIAEDIEAWWPKIKKGGRMACHDWEKAWVKEVILTAAKKWKWNGLEQAPFLYVARKKNPS